MTWTRAAVRARWAWRRRGKLDLSQHHLTTLTVHRAEPIRSSRNGDGGSKARRVRVVARKPSRRSRTTKRMRAQRSRVRDDPRLAGALEEIERVLATPLIELMDSEEERAHAQELTRQANLAPALARFRELLAFIGERRRATQAGKLSPLMRSRSRALSVHPRPRASRFGRWRISPTWHTCSIGRSQPIF
jgi:hypothetical protein